MATKTLKDFEQSIEENNNKIDELIDKELLDIDLTNKESYDGNKRVPKANLQIEWTQDKIKELQKCSTDIKHFAHNYFNIVTLDEGKKKIELYPAQDRLLTTLNNNRLVITLASRQVGKCVCGDTEITTRNKKTGEIKKQKIEDLFNVL